MDERSTLLLENKNTHLIHVEDDIFLSGYDGAINAHRFLDSLVKTFSGNTNDTSIEISTKWDGSPSIVFGKDPQTNNFFVGTKSVFNKNTPIVCFSEQDIRNHYKGNLQVILLIAFRLLEKLRIPSGKFYQGDVLFTGGELQQQKIHGRMYYTFTPNAITYAIPKKSELARFIKNSELGIVVHTEYTGSTIPTSTGTNITKLPFNRTSVKGLFLDDASYIDASGKATFTQTQTQELESKLNIIQTLIDQTKGTLNNIVSSKELSEFFVRYTNSSVKDNRSTLSSDRFIVWLDQHKQKRMQEVKLEKTQTNIESSYNELIGVLQRTKPSLDKVFELHNKMSEVKTMLVNQLSRVKKLNTFVKTKYGFRVTNPEGYVAVDRLTNKTVKLVDRLEFSKLNFTVAKNWDKDI